MTDFETAIKEARAQACGRPFTWGRDDCLLWIADIYKTVLGRDPAARFRKRYTTPAGALRVLKREGMVSVADALEDCAARMSWPECDPSHAEIGTLGMVETPHGNAGVICAGSFWIGRTEYGFTAIRADHVARAWRIV